jgi:hypothetical protein
MIQVSTFIYLQCLNEVFDAQELSQIPTDEEFKEKLEHMEIRTRVPAWRTILYKIYEGQGTGEMSIRGPDKVHIEHVLPQNPSVKALKECGFATRDEATDYISRLGNLTLLASVKNVKALNRPFSEKKALYSESEIPMTRDLNANQRWCADVIDRRSEELASIAARVFSNPAKIAEGS